jgi:hypothetical protein
MICATATAAEAQWVGRRAADMVARVGISANARNGLRSKPQRGRLAPNLHDPPRRVPDRLNLGGFRGHWVDRLLGRGILSTKASMSRAAMAGLHRKQVIRLERATRPQRSRAAERVRDRGAISLVELCGEAHVARSAMEGGIAGASANGVVAGVPVELRGPHHIAGEIGGFDPDCPVVAGVARVLDSPADDRGLFPCETMPELRTVARGRGPALGSGVVGGTRRGLRVVASASASPSALRRCEKGDHVTATEFGRSGG